jgi:tRNA(Ile)-lysidine synthase TilS/MesJ
MVCISGGKDSFLLAKCIQELIRHGKFKFEARFVCMNPGYNDYNLQYIKDNAKLMDIPIEIFESDIFDVIKKITPNEPCYMCARMRRGYLYSKAKELGCNKIALGHHFNDVIETSMLSILYSSEVKTMVPKLHSDNFEGIELIRPMYLVKEDDIISWKNYNELTFINCACPLLEGCSLLGNEANKRNEIKALIKKMKEKNPNVDNNIFISLSNVNLNCVLGYKKDKKEYSFLDEYDKE